MTASADSHPASEIQSRDLHSSPLVAATIAFETIRCSGICSEAACRLDDKSRRRPARAWCRSGEGSVPAVMSGQNRTDRIAHDEFSVTRLLRDATLSQTPLMRAHCPYKEALGDKSRGRIHRLRK